VIIPWDLRPSGGTREPWSRASTFAVIAMLEHVNRINAWTRSTGDLKDEIAQKAAEIAELRRALAHQRDLNAALTRRCAMAEDSARRAWRVAAS
jgi:hypothetical protein